MLPAKIWCKSIIPAILLTVYCFKLKANLATFYSIFYCVVSIAQRILLTYLLAYLPLYRVCFVSL